MGAEGLESEAASRETTRIGASSSEDAGKPGTNGGGSYGLGADALWSLLRLATQARRTDLVAHLSAQIAALLNTAPKHLRLVQGSRKK